MKKFYTPLIVLGSAVLMFLLNSSSGGSPGGKTGSPGDNGNTCTQCHSGTAISQDGLITSDMPEAGYTFGETYEITATVTDANAGKVGFELTAEDVSGNKIGNLIPIGNSTQLKNNDNAITHRSSSNTPSGGSQSWTFEWEAPSSDVGQITFYAAFNAADGTGGTGGDQVYTSTYSFDLNTIGTDNEKAQVSIYPNPATSYISINNVTNETSFLYNIEGKLIDKLMLTEGANRINLSDYPRGIYFIKIPSQNISKKIVLL
jgi:hypothetical protein